MKIEKIIEDLNKIQEYIKNQNYVRTIGVLAILTFLNWITIYIIFFLYTIMFETGFSFLNVIVSVSFVAIANSLPINLFGRFGTFELAWAFGFISLGMSKDVAIPLGLFVNISNTLMSCVLALLGYILLNSSRNLKGITLFNGNR
jgi:hypothetical protein